MVLATIVFVFYTVPEARDNFLRSQPEKILYSAIEKYMDDTDIKEWVDRIQSEVGMIWYNSFPFLTKFLTCRYYK